MLRINRTVGRDGKPVAEGKPAESEALRLLLNEISARISTDEE
jgi:hypothetical protein